MGSPAGSAAQAGPVRERGGGLLLADAPSLYFRAFYGVPRSVRAPDGTPVNAVRGLLDVLARQIVEIRPRQLVACFDADWRPAFRVALLASYKAHRVAVPADRAGAAAGGDSGGGDVEEVADELRVQLPIIDAVLDAFGIARAAAAGFEADDVIATLATRHRVAAGSRGEADDLEADDLEADGQGGAGGGGVDILTGDRDLFQLVDDAAGVRVRYAVERFAVVDEASVAARYGIPGRAYADFAVLRGDPSDGLPGVAGIGAKTAATLLGRFGSLAAILAALDTPPAAGGAGAQGLPAAARRRLLAARDYLAAAVGVVAVVRDCGVGDVDGWLPAAPVDPRAVAVLGERWGLAGPCTRLVTALGAVAAG
ncbi:5'-3' exonuclease (including N-terminal domain of PolI) [Frankia sp. QA3]|nr:5'-3' exonuclease (including N-terminal domain of PolI) [Frankia sp. QA3]